MPATPRWLGQPRGVIGAIAPCHGGRLDVVLSSPMTGCGGQTAAEQNKPPWQFAASSATVTTPARKAGGEGFSPGKFPRDRANSGCQNFPANKEWRALTAEWLCRYGGHCPLPGAGRDRGLHQSDTVDPFTFVRGCSWCGKSAFVWERA